MLTIELNLKNSELYIYLTPNIFLSESKINHQQAQKKEAFRGQIHIIL